MAQLLWNLGNLVNDPSTVLFHELRLRISSRPHDTAQATIDPRASTQIDIESIELADGACSHAVQNNKTYVVRKGKQQENDLVSVQVGTDASSTRQVGVQVRDSVVTKQHKSTSVEPIKRQDRNTDTPPKDTKDAQTKPQKLKICKHHQDVVLALRELPLESNFTARSNSKFSQLKSSITKILNSLKLEKIQGLPHYNATDEEIMKLYRCASLDMNVKQEPRRPPKGKPRKSVKLRC